MIKSAYILPPDDLADEIARRHATAIRRQRAQALITGALYRGVITRNYDGTYRLSGDEDEVPLDPQQSLQPPIPGHRRLATAPPSTTSISSTTASSTPPQPAIINVLPPLACR